ncbi:MAG: peptidylprolyl isomerase [Candidatus Poribacteria bacterium]|nr:peptidylprolyl isomerase [Candidatus Poribacteria bacterium]MDE0506782.1 peptidylprolyl isomerase [Candidatus Poribacteria bacterium]
MDLTEATPEEGTVIAGGDKTSMVDNFVQIHGNALIKSEDVVLYADHVWADFDDNIMRASGNVRLIVGKEETFADELIFDLETKKGIARDGFTFDDPWYFGGSEIFKIQDDESYIRGGRLTTCSLKHPHFYFSASQIIVKINKELIAKNIVLNVGGVPLFYFPIIRRDLRKEDKVAKIIVKLGTASYQGPYLHVILPIIRRHRYSAELIFEQSARRGRLGGTQGKYRVNDVKFQELLIPIPPEATPGQRAQLKDKADELSDHLQGEYDEFKLREVFMKYQITEADIEKAHEEAETLYSELKADGADFGGIAQQKSDHQESRYRRGDMGFLVPGERDDEGKLKLPPTLEQVAFGLRPGEMSPILRTDYAFHILRVDQVLDIYGVREIQVRRVDIAIEPSEETRETIRALGKEIQERAIAGEPLEDLVAEYERAEILAVNNGEPTPLNEMDQRWRYSIRRLKEPGEITLPVYTERGVHIFQLIEKELTPTFEEVARQFEAEWEIMKQKLPPLKTKEEQTEDGSRFENSKHTEDYDHEESDPDSAENGEQEEVQVYNDYGFRGRWEDPKPVASQAQRLDRGETSRVIKAPDGYRLIKVEKKRAYRGDFLFDIRDKYAGSRLEPIKAGQQWAIRWGHHHKIFTPWDNRKEGRSPLSFNGRVAWYGRSLKEGYGTSESTVRSFGIFTWGSALTGVDPHDLDPDENITFSRKRFGTFLSRFEVKHELDLIGEGTTTLQKLPQFTMQFSQMQFDQLPLFKTVNSGLTKVAEKLDTDLPILSMFAFPTLDNTRFDLDVIFGNFFKGRFRDERDVFLQTLDLGFDLTKQTTLQITPYREFRFDVSYDSNLIWHAKDTEGNQNILRGVYSLRARGSNTLFRIYDISFIPGARRMRHQIQSSLSLDYQPPVDRNNNLYPFGPSTYFFERRRLSYNFRTSIEVKTRRSKRPLSVLDFDTRLVADFSENTVRNRTYDPISSDVTITPLASRNLRITFDMTHDPNQDPETGKHFKMTEFSSHVRYGRKKWNVTIGSAFSKRLTSSLASRRILGSMRYSPSRLFSVTANLTYDWIKRRFYRQRISIQRNLHDWNLRLSWYRIGNVRQDFTLQLNLIADPTASVGFGYDATTDSWGFRTLPAGVPYNAFSARNALSRSYF